MSFIQPRVAAGIPAGGQFSAHHRNESEVGLVLNSDMSDDGLDFAADEFETDHGFDSDATTTSAPTTPRIHGAGGQFMPGGGRQPVDHYSDEELAAMRARREEHPENSDEAEARARARARRAQSQRIDENWDSSQTESRFGHRSGTSSGASILGAFGGFL